jgi:Tfp pilus assembly protein PilO
VVLVVLVVLMVLESGWSGSLSSLSTEDIYNSKNSARRVRVQWRVQLHVQWCEQRAGSGFGWSWTGSSGK